MLSQEALPESLLARCLDVLRILSPNERDLIRVVVEIIQDLRDRDEHADEEQDPSVNGLSGSTASPAYLRFVASRRMPIQKSEKHPPRSRLSGSQSLLQR